MTARPTEPEVNTASAPQLSTQRALQLPRAVIALHCYIIYHLKTLNILKFNYLLEIMQRIISRII